MPKLPEVEVVKESLVAILQLPQTIKSLEFMRHNIRNMLPIEKKDLLKGQNLLGVERRAKYLLFETEDYYMISHLGMTGSWRLSGSAPYTPEKHDHVKMNFKNQDTLIFQDPRRFGVFDIIGKDELSRDKRFTHLGPEPFDKDFNFKYLHQVSRNKKVPVKSFIMDQKIVVGVGNIYACEALFKAGISPLVQAGKLSEAKYKLLVEEIRKILKRAIKKGGSTISDFKQAEGKGGYFQDEFFVYGRKGQPCRKCGSKIKVKVLSGRSTFWCVKCQR